MVSVCQKRARFEYKLISSYRVRSVFADRQPCAIWRFLHAFVEQPRRHWRSAAARGPGCCTPSQKGPAHNLRHILEFGTIRPCLTADPMLRSPVVPFSSSAERQELSERGAILGGVPPPPVQTCSSYWFSPVRPMCAQPD